MRITIKFFVSILLVFGVNTNLFAKEYKVFPGIGNLNEIKGEKVIDTIDNYVFYNPKDKNLNKKLVNNVLLLQKVTDISLNNNKLTQKELDSIEESFNKVEKVLNSIDLVAKVTEFIVGANLLDAKGIAFSIWDLALKKKVQDIFPDDSAAVDVIEQLVKLSIDYVIEKTKFETSILTRTAGKEFTKGVLGKVTEKLNVAFMIYSGVSNTAKLANAYRSLQNVNDVQKEQIKNIMMSSFLYDYILKYKSDMATIFIQEKDINDVVNSQTTVSIFGSKTKNTHCNYENFWSIWYFYNKKNNDEEELFSKLSLSSLSIKEQYQVAFETWKLLAQYDAAFFKNLEGNGAFLKEYIDNDNTKVLKTLIRTKEYEIFNKLYYFPLKISDNDLDSIKDGYLCKENKFNIYFQSPSTESGFKVYFNKKIDNTNDEVNVTKVEKSSITYKSYYNNIEGKYKLDIKPFWLPAFFSDIPNTYWAISKIKVLFNKNVFGGYKDGSFKPKNDITIGEFLKILTNAIFLSTDKEIILSMKKDNITFSNYANFLKNKKYIDIGFTEGDYKTKLPIKAKRDYIAQVLTSLLVHKGITKKITCDKTDGDWNKCSDFLNSKGIVRGNNGSYLPNTNIARDEIAVMIVRTMNVIAGTKQVGKDRYGKDFK